jgi:hypothetical protein
MVMFMGREPSTVYSRSIEEALIMPSFRVRPWPVVVALVLLLSSSGSTVPTAEAQSGGTLVLGLDQEPPTLDPHASPSCGVLQLSARHHVSQRQLLLRPSGAGTAGKFHRSRGIERRTGRA